MSEQPTLGVIVGGQAVLEGVMMRAPWAYCVSVRRSDGELVWKEEPLKEYSVKIPIIRGFIVLLQALILGIRTLNFSAEVVEEKEKPISPWALGATMVLAFLFAAVLFLLLPLVLTQMLHLENGVLFNIVDGIIRVIIFFLYLLAISMMKDIRRVFQYHGAEHKVVHVFEAGEPLTVENAKVKTTLHPRCGTSFLLFVVLVAIAVFALIPHSSPFWVKLTGRVVLLPIISGIAYELIRLSHRCRQTWWARVLMAPGLMLQKITTKEPDDSMLEVAIFSMERVLKLKNSPPETIL
ncbi:MAG TPA: DUF1385 domain-containing protein [Thermoanaerobaculia bacterium]|nr:DUF1385 domain-containing protein [Thermoanaerobaculia bacterium]HUM30163.1 DUF1385 domain-containing protein [Thermoanaerobaculia bacterium]HXK68388.1 DUF1385 domain-containing protein [Thermoanaerobaculia bacterium]